MDSLDDSKHYEIFSKFFTERAHLVLSGEEPGTPEDLLALGDLYLELMDDCESPIEKMLGARLLFAHDGYNSLKFLPFHDANSPEELRAFRPEFGTIFYPQARVAEYRVDFFLVTTCKGESSFTVIECDGHDFHEKTKEQVSRDKKRDRAITAAGASILRFSGSDIHRKLEECVEEIEEVLSNKAEDVLARAGMGRGKEIYKL